MIDFHCHLDLYPKPAVVIAESARRGCYVLAVTTTPRAFEGNLRFVGDRKRIRVAVGLHPELVKDRHGEVDEVIEYMDRTRYVGEVGLDGSHDHRDSLPAQRRVLRRIFEACRARGGKVVSLHSRGAATAVLDEIQAVGAAGVGTPVLHWFSGSEAECARAGEMGCWFSVGPAMLASAKGSRLASMMPKERVLPETDGPFAQREGKPLMPWDCDQVYPTLGDLWGITGEAARKVTLDNLRRLLAHPSEPNPGANL